MRSFLYPKAYFNWLRLTKKNNSLTEKDQWKIENYRGLPTKTLFKRLTDLGFSLSLKKITSLVDSFKTPEELSDHLCKNADIKFQVYLLIFEIWRRTFPNKICLSIQTDELDHLMSLYQKDPDSIGQMLQNSLESFKRFMEEYVDEGISPIIAFNILNRYLAHDLEEFLYDFISDQIKFHHYTEAEELLNIFGNCGLEKLWIDFFKAQLLIINNVAEGNKALSSLLDQLSNKLDIDLLLEIASFLVHRGNPYLFQRTCLLILTHLKKEEEFQDLLAIIADYCFSLDKEKEEKEIQKIFQDRIHRNLEIDVSSDYHHPHFLFVEKFLKSLFDFKNI